MKLAELLPHHSHQLSLPLLPSTLNVSLKKYEHLAIKDQLRVSSSL